MICIYCNSNQTQYSRTKAIIFGRALNLKPPAGYASAGIVYS